MTKQHFFFGRTNKAACGSNGASGGYRNLNKGDFDRWLALPKDCQCSRCLKSYLVQSALNPNPRPKAGDAGPELLADRFRIGAGLNWDAPGFKAP